MRREHLGASLSAMTLLILCLPTASCSFDPSGTIGDPAPTDASNPNSHRCICDCITEDGTPAGYAYQMCYSPAFNPVFNPALPDDYTPTPGELAGNCQDVLEPNIEEFSDECGPTELACTCFMPGGGDNNLLFAAECNEVCEEVELNDDTCSNFDIDGVKEATNVPGEDPVCLAASADPPTPKADPLASVLFGERTRCEVAGDMIVNADGDERTVPASGIVEIVGQSCPGMPCNRGLYFELRADDDLTYSGLLGLVTVRLSQMAIVGSTQPGAVPFDATGFALVPAGATLSTARGVRTDSDPFGDDVSTGGFLSSNSEPIAVSIDWQNGTCALTGTLLGTADDEVSVGAAVDLTGTIVNQPPDAQASSPSVVECTSPAGASITLDGSGSTDPDNNIVTFQWRRGSQAGPRLGAGPVVIILQAVNTTMSYVLQVMDESLQADQDSVDVTVVDTTAPTITAVNASPNTLWPPNHRLVSVTLAVSASDVCGATTCNITEVTSNQPESAPGDPSPDSEITGALTVNLRAERRGGSTREYTIEVECSDPSGNRTTSTTTVTVPRDQSSSARTKARRRHPR